MVYLAYIWREVMKDAKFGRGKKVAIASKIITDSDAVAVDYAKLIAKAAAVVRQRQQQYAVSRAGISVTEPRNGILVGFVSR